MGLLRLRLCQALLLGLLGPIAQQCSTELLNLLDGPLLRFIGTTTRGDGGLHHIRNGLQPRIGLRVRSKALIQGALF